MAVVPRVPALKCHLTRPVSMDTDPSPRHGASNVIFTFGVSSITERKGYITGDIVFLTHIYYLKTEKIRALLPDGNLPSERETINARKEKHYSQPL